MDRRRFLATLGAVGLAGCSALSDSDGRATITAPDPGWSQFRGGPRRQGYTSRGYPAEDSAVLEPATDIRSVTAPLRHGSEMIVATPDALVAIDLEARVENFRIAVAHQPTLPPAVGSGVAALVTGDGVAAYDIEDRSTAWALPAERTYGDPAAPAALGRHFVIQDGNRLRLVTQQTGSVVWERTFDARVEGFATSTDTLVVIRTTGEKSELVSLDPADGTRDWSITVEASRLHPVVGEHVYALSEYGRLYAIDDGEVRWEVETELLNPRSLSVGDGYAVAGPDVSNEYVGVDTGEAMVTWREQVEFGNPPVIASQQAFVPGANAGLVRLNIESGTQVQTHPEARFVDSLVPYDDGLLYTRRPDGRVRFLKLDE